MELAMEVFFDPETRQWGYTVPALSLVGTGCRTKQEARGLGIEAIANVLDSSREQLSADSEIVLLKLDV